MSSAGLPPPQFSAENLRELEVARQPLRKIRRAASTARIEGLTIAGCGALTFVFGIGSAGDMLGGAVLTAIGIIEFVHAGRLSRLDEKSIRVLTINQICLAALILLYALWKLYGEISSPSSDYPDLSAADAQVAGQVTGLANGLTHTIYLLVYSSLIFAAAAEAAIALYYHSRGAHLQRFLAETPPWIIEMQKSGISI